jgi:HIRAN domain
MNIRTQTLVFRVAGVTFDNRQATIARLRGDEPVRVVPEPTNKFDPNALAVLVAVAPGDVRHVGYVPRELAARIAPFLEGEAVMAEIRQITGGFETWDHGTASLGLLIAVSFPEEVIDDNNPEEFVL